MYGLTQDQWEEIGWGRRVIARMAQALPARLRFKLCGLPSGVVSVEATGSSVQGVKVTDKEGLYRVPHGWVWTRGAHLDEQFRIVDEISPGVNRPPAWWFVRRQKFFPRIVPCAGTVFSMIGDAAENLYHWTFDVLPRLRLIDPAERAQIRVLARLVHPFHRACLEAAGIPPEAIIPAESMTFYPVDNLLAAKVVKGLTPDNLAFAREVYLKAAGPVSETDMPARLYISRARATSRRIVNEEALLKILAPHGFRTVFMETLPLAEQLALFRDAEAILAPTGAALTHIHLCQANVRLLVLMPVGCDDFLYRDMAQAVGLSAQLLDVPLAEAHADPVKADLILDEACLAAVQAFAKQS